jgi:ABC-type branched-subunit amino acid transport system permease subunit
VNARAVAIAANAVLGLSVVLLPWYALGPYEPNGWDATWWARAAVAAALAGIVLLRLRWDRLAAVAAALGLACVVVRVAAPPDFGFGFDGLTVPTERRVGCWFALAASATALLASLWSARWSPSSEYRPTPKSDSSAAAAP